MDAVDIFHFDQLQRQKQSNIRLGLIIGGITLAIIGITLLFKYFAPKKTLVSTTIDKAKDSTPTPNQATKQATVLPQYQALNTILPNQRWQAPANPINLHQNPLYQGETWYQPPPNQFG